MQRVGGRRRESQSADFDIGQSGIPCAEEVKLGARVRVRVRVRVVIRVLARVFGGTRVSRALVVSVAAVASGRLDLHQFCPCRYLL